jgi:hypothetical protein
VVRDKLLFMRNKTSFRLCVPRAVQPVLLKEFHDTPVAGHMVSYIHTLLCRVTIIGLVCTYLLLAILTRALPVSKTRLRMKLRLV